MKSFRLLLGSMVLLLYCACGTESQKENLKAQKPTDNQVVETIMTRRSVRKYKPQAISRDTMQIILNAGIHAPNGKGIESWEVRVVDNPEFLDGVGNIYKEQNSRGNGNSNSLNMFYNAPVVVFIAYDPSYDLSQVDCGLLGENMILTAWSMGFGSCCLGGAARFLNTNPDAAEYLKKLDFPDTHQLLYCIAFGIPDETPKAKPRTQSKVRFIEN